MVIPPAVGGDPRAVELVRVWGAHGAQHVSLRADAWDDPAAWGICLVDLVRHIANAYEQQKGLPRAKVIERIREVMAVEWASPTAEAKGGVLK